MCVLAMPFQLAETAVLHKEFCFCTRMSNSISIYDPGRHWPVGLKLSWLCPLKRNY